MNSETDGDLFQAVTRTETELQVKLVNLSDSAVPLTLRLAGVQDQTARGSLLTGEKNHANSFARPDKIAPQTVECACENGEANLEMPPYSLLILTFSLADDL